MAEVAAKADLEPTFDLPTGGSSDFYLSREVNDHEDSNHGKVIKKHGLWKYPYLTRRTGDSLVGTNGEITSNEFRHGGTASKTKLGNASSSGSHDFEYSPETFDDQMEGVFRNEWVRWENDGEPNLITKDYHTKKGYIHVRGDDGTYNQISTGKNVTAVPLFYTENEAGTAEDPFGLIKISPENMGANTRAAASNPLGKFVVHELHIGEKPVKYSFISRIPINEKAVRYQNYKHVEVGEMNLNVTVNAIVTGSMQLMGSNNPSYYTERAETGKTRMAEKMGLDKDVAISGVETSVPSDELYSGDFKDAAEKFLATVKNTTSSTNTDQFTAMEGFLYVNGHQLQFASDLTMDLNNNLQSINAIFVKGAIANISPSLTVSGNITAYFTDGEKDSTGTKFGADDLKNLASENKDVEIVYAFQDKEDPECLYLFQVFKSTFSAPDESKDANNPITLNMTYNSYGEMAVRCLRLAIPKIRKIEFDSEPVVKSIKDGDEVDSINLILYPNVPLDPEHEADYVDSSSDSYIFKGENVEVYVNSEEVTDFSIKNVAINGDGAVEATLQLPENIAKDDLIQLKLRVNGEDIEETVEIVPTIYYVRMGKRFAEEKYAEKAIEVQADGTIDILTKTDSAAIPEDEDYLFYIYKRAEGYSFTKDDFKFKSSDESVAVIIDGVVTIDADAQEGDTAVITVTSLYDDGVTFDFVVKVTA